MSLTQHRTQVLRNSSGTTIPAGDVVRLDGNNALALGSAGTAANAAKTLGVAYGTSGGGGTCTVVTRGIARVNLVTGLTVAAGEPLYASTTAGKATNVAPANVAMLGTVIDASRYADDDYVTALVARASAASETAGGARYTFAAEDMRSVTAASADLPADIDPTGVIAGLAYADDGTPIRFFDVTETPVNKPAVLLPVFQLPVGTTQIMFRELLTKTQTGEAGSAVRSIRARSFSNGASSSAWTSVNLVNVPLDASRYDSTSQQITFVQMGASAGDYVQVLYVGESPDAITEFLVAELEVEIS